MFTNMRPTVKIFQTMGMLKASLSSLLQKPYHRLCDLFFKALGPITFFQNGNKTLIKYLKTAEKSNSVRTVIFFLAMLINV